MVSAASQTGTLKTMEDETSKVEVDVLSETEGAVERGRSRRRRTKPAATEASVNMDELRETYSVDSRKRLYRV